ncbi:MAG: hypothetical protein KDD89_08790, partial [Anaerolineales bacterium]|nr:hypothetical protein [Anaerolineales bacterium]
MLKQADPVLPNGTNSRRPHYGPEIEAELAHLVAQICQHTAVVVLYPPRWLAIKLLEQDQPLQQTLLTVAGGPA